MGDDFTNHQVFVGSEEPAEFRQRLISSLRGFLAGTGYLELEDSEGADRSIAVGPAEERWICVYDSAGNGDDPLPDDFEQLARHLSKLSPVVDIYMDDSAAVHFYLYQDGRRVDQFANLKGVVTRWESEQERAAYQGRPDVWSHALLHPNDVARLRAAWQQPFATEILPSTAAVLGWHPLLCEVGYTIDYDGIPVYFREHLRRDPVDLSGFDEYYFQRDPSCPNRSPTSNW